MQTQPIGVLQFSVLADMDANDTAYISSTAPKLVQHRLT
jgi:hypothetical protein